MISVETQTRVVGTSSVEVYVWVWTNVFVSISVLVCVSWYVTVTVVGTVLVYRWLKSPELYSRENNRLTSVIVTVEVSCWVLVTVTVL